MDNIILTGDQKSIQYTVTAQSNNNSYGTVSLDGNVITGSPNDGYRYADPAYTVSPANSATVDQNGNEFIVTPSANTTITINFETIPVYIVDLKIGETLYTTVRQTFEGETINLTDSIPNISRACELNGWQFVGWINSNDKDNRNLITTITPTKDTTLYALFRILEESGENVVDTLTKNDFEATGNTYMPFNNVVKHSGAIYNGQTAAQYGIQMNINTHGTPKIHDGIFNSVSGGKLENIEIKWNDNTPDPPLHRALLIYERDTALKYTDDMFNNDREKDSIVYKVSNKISLNGHQFIGLRASGGVIYLDTIFITWSTASYEYSINPKCFETNISVAEWFEDKVEFDIGDYEDTYTYNKPLNSCDSIRIKITNDNDEDCIRWFQVPIFAGAYTSKNDCNCDVVVLHDSTFTVSNNMGNSNVYVYGTLIIDKNKTYTVNSLTLRRDNDSVPQLLYNGTLDIKNGMFFEMRTDGEDWRWLTLPDTFKTSVVNDPEEVVVKYYDGDYRAKNGKNGWKEEWNGAKNYTKQFAPGEGCIFGVISDNKRIYKIELDTNILSKEKNKKYIRVHPYFHSNKPINDLGWNLVGNPFMTTYNVSKGFGSVFNVSDSLVKEIVDGQWTGKWITEYKHVRYIVVPSNKQEQHIIDAGGYEQICLEDGYKLKPFTSFFIQVKQGADTLVFYYGQKVANAPVRMKTNKDEETFLRINVGSIKTGCYISNKFTDDYEIGDDMESLYSTYQFINNYKLLYSAVNDSIINNGVTVYTTSGNLTLDEKTNVNEFSEINVLYNGHWYDLLHGETLNVSGSFILQATRNQNDIHTGLNETIINAGVKKFIHNGYIYVVRDNETYSILGAKIR